MSITAMKQALEALEEINKLSIGEGAICLPAEIDTAMDALRQAIEQAEKQEPTEDMVLALRGASGLGTEDAIDALRDVLAVMPLYTTPQPQREWVWLTDEEITALKRNGERYISSQEFARAIEAKLRSKNT